MFLEVLSALASTRHSTYMWHYPSVPCSSSFHSSLCQLLSFSAVLLHSFFSDTKFCICQCITRTRIVKIFCLAARLGSSNQLGLEVMMGWRRQPRPSMYKCSHGPKILLATPAPGNSVCLNYCVFQCACAGWLCLPHSSWVSGTSRIVSVVVTKHLLALGPEGKRGDWLGMRHVVDRSLVNIPCGSVRVSWGSCRSAQLSGQLSVVMISLHKNGEGGTSSSAPLAIHSASTVKHGEAQTSPGEKTHMIYIRRK